jgi:hypothetical protein
MSTRSVRAIRKAIARVGGLLRSLVFNLSGGAYRTLTLPLSGVCLCWLAVCAVTAPIQPAASSKSGFEGTRCKGTTVRIHEAVSGRALYRVFQQGATGFVPIQSVRDEAEQRANDFCKRKNGGVMESLEETIANPPFILGNFPRIEIIFDCVPAAGSTAMNNSDTEYVRLLNLKKLLDSGAITQAEFASEKAQILSPR